MRACHQEQAVTMRPLHQVEEQTKRFHIVQNCLQWHAKKNGHEPGIHFGREHDQCNRAVRDHNACAETENENENENDSAK